jgi:RimJ/RimL family protein N-acetyltransferase
MTAPSPLQTDRMSLDPWTESDFTLLEALARTPAVMRHIGDGTTWTDARIADVGAHVLEHWRAHGFGWRVARVGGTPTRVARVGGTPIGLIALNFAGEGAGVDAREYEIGWWLAPGAWGRGLAREGAAAVRDEAFAQVGAPSIIARIQPANAASRAVAAAIGLSYESDSVRRGGETIAVLRLEAHRWREAISPTAPGSPPAARPGAPA